MTDQPTLPAELTDPITARPDPAGADLRTRIAAAESEDVHRIDIYEQDYADVAATLEMAADARAPISVTTCSNNVTTYLPVRLDGDRLAADARPNTTCGCGHPHAAHWGESASGRTECMAGDRCPCGGPDVPRGPRSPEALAADARPTAGGGR